MYQASGIFAPLTPAELCRLDAKLLEAQRAQMSLWSGAHSPAVVAELADIRRDVNAEWGNR